MSTNLNIIYIFSIYLSKSFRRGSFNNKPKTYDIPFKSGDVCMITYFEDFTCLYVCKAKKNDQHSYELINENIPLMTLKSEGMILLIFNLLMSY